MVIFHSYLGLPEGTYIYIYDASYVLMCENLQNLENLADTEGMSLGSAALVKG